VNRRNRPQKLDREHAAVRKNIDHNVEGPSRASLAAVSETIAKLLKTNREHQAL
jgi:hypothetical protein